MALHLSQKVGWGLKEEREGGVDPEMYEEKFALQLKTEDAGVVSLAGAHILLCLFVCFLVSCNHTIAVTVDTSLKWFVVTK